MSARAAKTRPHALGLDESELRVSAYDHVASLIVALLLLLGICVGLLLMVWLSVRVLTRPDPIPVIVEEIRGPGGVPEGFAGEGMNLEGPMTDEIGSDPALIVPQMQRTMEVMADAMARSTADLSNPSLSEELATGGIGGSRGDGRRPALGVGGGDGAGIPRQQRWEIVFPEGQTPEQYAAFLDQFQIELAAVGAGPEIEYASKFAGAGSPVVRKGRREDEKRMYLSWSRGQLRDADLNLLRRAGVGTQGRIVVQFVPPELENLLAFKEREFAQRDATRIRRTRFRVVAREGQYDFEVDAQTPL